MKITTITAGMVIGFAAFTNAAFANDELEQPIEVMAPVEKVFLPTGFDNNDNTEVILHGEFPNSCYKIGHSSYTVDPENNTIEVALTAYKYRSSICAQVLTPYVESIKVGILAAGNYKVTVKGSDIQETMRIGQSIVSSPDQYIYAQVDNAFLISAKSFDEGAAQKVKLVGAYPYTFVGCAVMDRVEIIHVREDILEVLPILKLLENDPACERESNDFEVEANVSSELIGEGLLHVRSVNGSSVNKVVQGL